MDSFQASGPSAVTSPSPAPTLRDLMFSIAGYKDLMFSIAGYNLSSSDTVILSSTPDCTTPVAFACTPTSPVNALHNQGTLRVEFLYGGLVYICYKPAVGTTMQVIGTVTVSGVTSTSSFTGFNSQADLMTLCSVAVEGSGCNPNYFQGQEVTAYPFTFRGMGLNTAAGGDTVKFVLSTAVPQALPWC